MTERALSRPQFTQYAWTQIRIAEDLLTRHRTTGPACSCGRADPCPHAQSLRATRQHYLALLAPTRQLPVLSPPPVRRRPSCRSLVHWLIGKAHHGDL